MAVLFDVSDDVAEDLEAGIAGLDAIEVEGHLSVRQTADRLQLALLPVIRQPFDEPEICCNQAPDPACVDVVMRRLGVARCAAARDRAGGSACVERKLRWPAERS